MRKENVVFGAAFVMLAALSFSAMGVAVKLLGSSVSNEQVVFMRNSIALVLLLPLVLLPRPKPLTTKVMPSHLVRGLAAVFSAYCLFYAIHHILLADAILLTNTMPLFVPFVMFFWKKEKIPIWLFPPLLISFLGVIFILRPSADVFHIASLVALGAGLFMSISTCGMRELGKTEPLYRIMFYTLLIGTLASALPLFGNFVIPDIKGFLLLSTVAICGALYQLFLTIGYQFASPTKVSPFIYFAVVVSGVVDWIIWKQKPDLFSFFGLLLVVTGAIWCTRIESGSRK